MAHSNSNIVTDPDQILSLIVCPKCKTKSFDTFYINDYTTTKKIKTTQLFFMCGYCDLSIQVHDEILIKIFWNAVS